MMHMESIYYLITQLKSVMFHAYNQVAVQVYVYWTQDNQWQSLEYIFWLLYIHLDLVASPLIILLCFNKRELLNLP